MLISRDEAIRRDIKLLNDWREIAKRIGTYDQNEQYDFMIRSFERRYNVNVVFDKRMNTHVILPTES